MAITDNKIITWTSPIVNEADRPQRSAADMKAVFDSNSNQLKTALNNLIDALAAGGASDIGAQVEGMAGLTIEAIFAELKTAIDAHSSTLSAVTGAAGASKIGGTVPNMTGDTVQALLTEMKGLVDTINSIIDTNSDGLLFLANDGTYKLPSVGAAANGVKAGGAEGQIYVKKSTTVYDAEWKDLGEAGSGVFAAAAHTHEGYAASNHTHDGTYSPAAHNHDGTYQPAGSYAAPSAALAVSLDVASWAGAEAPYSLTVAAPGVTADSSIVVSPAPASFDAYGAAQVRCTAQAANSLTFQCGEAPVSTLTVNILIVG